MNLDLTEDQRMIAQGAQAIAARHRDIPQGADYYITSAPLERDLAEGGFLFPELQLPALESLLIVEQIARSPFAVEIAVSSMLAAVLPRGAHLPRPIAITRSLTRPVRFLQPGGTLLLVGDNEVRAFAVTADTCASVQTPFAYPYARPARIEAAQGRLLDAGPGTVLQWWRAALAAEIAAAGRSALDLTVEHVKTREQFGQPIGGYQVIQHRLAVCAMMVEAIEISTRRAAVTGSPRDALLALTLAQDAASNLHHECAQFHGAMGLTLEAPLHHFTYRLRALQGELGGISEQAVALAGAETDYHSSAA
jgi:alkylation response protein AidB-like acyl-CoA dehydrogenase